MNVALGFLLLAGAFMLAGQFGLKTAEWPRRAPRLGIALWQALSGATVVSLLLACVALTLPGMSVVETLGEIIRVCVVELSHQYSSVASAVVSSLGIVLLSILFGRLAKALWSRQQEAKRARTRHLTALTRVARPTGDNVFHLDHDAAAVYCVADPRRGAATGAVVVTRGAREALTHEQLGLVLRHERAHLRSRHDRLVLRSRALADALPWLPFFRTVHEQISSLVEMHADDAVAPKDRPTLAVALYRLAGGGTAGAPSGALGAGGAGATMRARRLVLPYVPLRRTSVALVVAAIFAVGAAPAALALVPSDDSLFHNCCVQ